MHLYRHRTHTPIQALAVPAKTLNPINILAPSCPVPADKSVLPALTRKRSLACILPSHSSTSSNTSDSHPGKKQLFNSNQCINKVLLAIPDAQADVAQAAPITPTTKADNSTSTAPNVFRYQDDSQIASKHITMDADVISPAQVAPAAIATTSQDVAHTPTNTVIGDESILPPTTRKRSFACLIPSETSNSNETIESPSNKIQLFNSNRLINDQVERLGRIYRRENAEPLDKSGFQLLNDDALYLKAQIDHVEDIIRDLRGRLSRRNNKQMRW